MIFESITKLIFVFQHQKKLKSETIGLIETVPRSGTEKKTAIRSGNSYFQKRGLFSYAYLGGWKMETLSREEYRFW
jgi:hypothetical protein